MAREVAADEAAASIFILGSQMASPSSASPVIRRPRLTPTVEVRRPTSTPGLLLCQENIAWDRKTGLSLARVLV